MVDEVATSDDDYVEMADAKAIDMHPQAKKALADEATMPGLRRTMVKTAIILGFPVAE